MRRLRQWGLRVFGLIPWPVVRVGIGVLKPSYVVGATAVVMDDAGRILLVRHSYKPGWSTPGGFIDRKESPGDAVVREVWEETGLKVVVDGEPVAVVRSGERIVEMVHRVRPVDPDAEPHPVSAEIAEVRWFPQEDLPDLSIIGYNGITALARAEAERAEWQLPPVSQRIREPGRDPA